MNETIAGERAAPPENSFESSARAMSEFVIRAAILPVTLLFSKPADLARGAATGDYRLLPSPFLLALITGVVVSGVSSNLDKFRIPTPTQPGEQTGERTPDFVQAVTEFYMKMDGVQAILFALPYIFGVWALSSILSFFMLRGVRESQTLFAPLSWCLSAIVELTIVTVLVSLSIGLEQSSVGTIMFAGFMIFTLVLSVKLVRLVLALRKERASSWAGAVIASAFALTIVMLSGMVGSAVSMTIFQQRVFVRAIYDAEADGRRADALNRAAEFERSNDMAGAIAEYGKAIEADPDFAQAYHERGRAHLRQREYASAVADYDRAVALDPANADYFALSCRARAAWGEETDRALAHCNQALELRADHQETLSTRGLVQLRRGDLDAALADFGAALAGYDPAAKPDPIYAQALYGRGLVKLRQGAGAAGRADLNAALALDPSAASQIAQYGLAPQGSAGEAAAVARP